MKLNQLFLALGTAGMVAFGVAAPALAGDQDFTIVNKTGMSFKEIYVEATSVEDSWGENLADGPLKNGEELEIQFDAAEEECSYDMLLVDAAGKKWEVTKIDLCKIHEFTLTKSGNGLKWTAK